MFHSFDSGSERAKMLEAARRRDFPEQFQVDHVQWCDTVRQMLSTDPEDRPTARELLNNEDVRSDSDDNDDDDDDDDDDDGGVVVSLADREVTNQTADCTGLSGRTLCTCNKSCFPKARHI
ncbi:hypothetical protein DPMN_094250 [Dreissena polymorpha]|uniref:Uncharacterized protein n=1 Tax=Dreissena polymorpha TaxID=45954 RepID=A0A9D4L4G2_DREPO|nr:hypothetical protein DPMN_094250 [Dreissena polymorpha]